MAVPTKREIMEFTPMNLGEPEELPTYHRKDYPALKKLIDSGLMVAVTGLRRVGKTTIIKQLTEKQALYFSFDEKKYMNQETLKRVIEVFLEEKDKPLIVLDEVFRVKDWNGIIKRYHDQKKAKFVLSGSSALMIKKGLESLGGRLIEHYLRPLTFIEFLGVAWGIFQFFLRRRFVRYQVIE